MELPNLKNIRSIRKLLNWTQAFLAKKTGISQSMINKIERGTKEPSYHTANKIFSVLNFALKNQSHSNKKAKSISTKKIEYLDPNDSVKIAISKLSDFFDQLPVINKLGRCIGTITSKLIMNLINQVDAKDKLIKEVMAQPLPQVGEDTPLSHIQKMLEVFEAILTMKNGEISGIITRSDLIKGLEKN